jgi:hypothetical protein
VYGLTETHDLIEAPKNSRLPFQYKLANYLHDHPCVLVVGLGVPFAGTVLYRQMQLTHLTISQRVMHSRVFAQMGVLTIALTTMAFKSYMDHRGPYLEPD